MLGLARRHHKAHVTQFGASCADEISAHFGSQRCAHGVAPGHGKPGHAAPLDGDKDLTWKPGGGGQAAKERAKEFAHRAARAAEGGGGEERKAEKEAAAKEAASACVRRERQRGGRAVIGKFFELGKCNRGGKFRHEVAAAAPEDGDAADAAEALTPRCPPTRGCTSYRASASPACSMAACCSALAAVVATKACGRRSASSSLAAAAEAAPASRRAARRRAARVLRERGVVPRCGARRAGGRARPGRDDVGLHRRRPRILDPRGQDGAAVGGASGRRLGAKGSRTRRSAATSASSVRARRSTTRPGRGRSPPSATSKAACICWI